MRDFCHRCLDAGLVEAYQGAFKTLALCFCKQGKKQTWRLPMIPLQGFRDEPLDWREYKPNEIMSYQEKINWHLERVKTAEMFWASQTQSEPGGAA